MSTPNLTAAELAERLAEERAVITVQRDDLRKRRRLDAEHRDALAEVEELTTSRKRARRERDRDEVDQAALAELYRHATRAGARARIRTDIQRSAEMRALRIARVRSATLWIGLPVLIAFGAWSTAGVQAGVDRLLGLDDRAAGWWAAWSVEPALLTVVAAIIIGRAVLRSSGGDTDGRATLAEWTALGTSIALNMAGGWVGTGWDALGGALAHSVGPLGAAGTAWLISLFDSYVTSARPWEGAPRLAELDLTAPASAVELQPTAERQDDLEALVEVTAPTTQEMVEQAVTRHLADLPVAIEQAAVAAEVPAVERPRLRPSAGRTTSRIGRRRPAINVTVVAASTPRRAATEPAAPKPAKTSTSATGRGRPSAAQKVANFAAKHPDMKPAEIAKKLGISADTVRRHKPAIVTAVNGHDHGN